MDSSRMSLNAESRHREEDSWSQTILADASLSFKEARSTMKQILLPIDVSARRSHGHFTVGKMLQ